MNVDEAALAEERFAALLAAYDEQLAGGSQLDVADGSVAPEMRARLEQAASCLHLLDRVWPRQLDRADRLPSSDAVSNRAAAHPAQYDILGDFRLLREVGRGGMGVVYEAEQISLGRRVAVKVLPFASALDSKQLQRFRHEAQAAAHLQHDHIVPVHAVGCDDGVHFFAMQFIEGPTLAALISAMRQDLPAEQPFLAALSPNRPEYFRAVAELGIQAALALEHAHQMGVIHRDVKPANLILDSVGKVWMTDFGLARFDGDAGLTESGDWMGTLRYMSPEQSLSKHDLIDQRSDVYSLGATLYELATLEPLFTTDDRHELIRQIASDEPRPLRKVRPGVPLDLQTVVLKALEKSPGGRYGSAQDLADDLRRFLRDEPIRAQPPTAAQHALKWLRRHSVLATSAAGVGVLILILAVVGLAIANRFIAAERAQAVANLRVADENFQIACDSVDRMLTRVADERLLDEPGTVRLRRRLLEDARDFCVGLLRQRGTDPQAQCGAGRAYCRLGMIQRQLGEPAAARESAERAVEILDKLAKRFPEKAQYQAELAEAYLGAAVAFGLHGNLGDEERASQRCIALVEPLAAAFPEDRSYQSILVKGTAQLAHTYLVLRRYSQAIEIASKALDRAKAMMIALPGDLEVRLRCANCHDVLASALRFGGRPAEAEGPARQAVTLLRERDALLKHDPESRHVLANALVELGEILAASGRPADAEQPLTEGFQIEQELTVAFPGMVQYQSVLGVASHRLTELLVSSGRAQEAEKTFLNMLSVYANKAAQYPEEPSYRAGMAYFYQNLAMLLFETSGRHEDGVAPLGKARDLLQGLVEEYPRSASYRALFFRCLVQQAGVQAAHQASPREEWLQKDRDKVGDNRIDAAQTYARAIALVVASEPDFPGSALDPVEVSGAFCSQAIYLKNQGRTKEALAVLRQAEATGAFAFVNHGNLTVDEMLLGGRAPIACALIGVNSARSTEDPIDDDEQVRWRRLALDSLRRDLNQWTTILHGTVPSDQIRARARLESGLRCPELTGARDSTIDRFPASERAAWRRFWADVRQTLAEAR